MNGHNGDSSGANKNSSNTSIHLYAEFLKNIGTVSIQAHLPTVSNNATKATLSASHHQFNLSHDGEFVSIQLPTRVSHDINQATLTIPAAPSKDLSFRLKVEEKPSGNELRRNGISNAENIMPWMASDLTPETEMYCAYCGSKLIGRGSVKRWKDLPSEGWAEMMDLWHCHKPHEPNGRENSGGVSRGIGGESKLAIEIGVGLVSPLDLIFATDDCMGIEVGIFHSSLGFSSPAEIFYLHAIVLRAIKRTSPSRPHGHISKEASGYNLPYIEQDFAQNAVSALLQ